MAAALADNVRYESAVQPGEEAAEVDAAFVDYLEHGGATHAHRCKQRLEFDAAGLISFIQQVDLPRELQTLATIFDSVGVSRPVAGLGDG